MRLLGMRKLLGVATLLPLLAGADDKFIHHMGLSFGKKQVPVTIQHPAALAVALKGKTVVVTPIGNGPCLQEFSDQLEQMFQSNGVNLVDRANFATIMREQHLEASDAVDAGTAVQLGKVAGLAAMIFVHVSRCVTRQDPPLTSNQYVGPPLLISRTESHFQASIKTVDSATGRVLGTNPIQSDPRRENNGTGPLQPEYPPIEEVQDVALQSAIQSAEHLYFPWSESRTVAFLDSKTCNLKQAYDMLRAGDIDGTLKLSLENAEACKSDPKAAHQADALYNLGVTYMLMHRYTEALDALHRSQQLHSDNTVIQTILECKRARETEQAAKLQAERADTPPPPVTKSQSTQSADALTNNSIVEMVKGGLPDSMIVKEIARKICNFALNPSDLVALKKAGVPDAVIEAMLDKK